MTSPRLALVLVATLAACGGPDPRDRGDGGGGACVPDQLYCGGATGGDVYRCNADGTEGSFVESCPAELACSMGMCKSRCEAAEDVPSNVGCDFWAADLDNEASTTFGVNNDAAAAQFAIVAANNNDFPVSVRVTKNASNIGQPLVEEEVVRVMVPPRVAQRIDLPQREVDGAMGQNAAYVANSGSGTFVSPHAYHVVSDGPIVVYQFNPIIQQYSNDASTLIPRQAVGTDYIAVGFETANPCAISGLPTPAGIPDRGAITIIPIADDTHVSVTTNHAIKASSGPSGVAIGMVPKGSTLQLTLSRYMVANLETEQPSGDFAVCSSAVSAGADGDFTGTYIKSDKPIVVFTSNERGIGLGGATNVENPPNWNGEMCCTDHLEEQLFPVTALGKEFAVAHSPIRSTNATWREPDIIRVVGTKDGTQVTTNLPAPWDSFTLDERQDKTFAATTGFAMSASEAVQVSSYLVSQHFIPDGNIGDPSQILIPAAEQHRKDYVFLVPETFEKDYVVFSKPVAAQVALDGGNLASCTTAPIGTVNGTDYEQVTCPLTDGQHTASGDMPFGISVYGYYSVGSYAYVGGSDVKIINPIL